MLNVQTTIDRNFIYDTLHKDRLLRVTKKVGQSNTVNEYVLTYSSTNPFYPSSINNTSLIWDKGRLIQYGTNIYEYDTNGRRIGKIVGTKNYTYKYEDNKLVKEIITDSTNGIYVTLDFIYNQDNELIGVYNNNKTYYYDKDITGEIIGIVDESGNYVVEYEYTAYGTVDKILGPSTDVGLYNPFVYKGYYYDVETGYFWLSSRYYSPELCRFISPADVSSLNPSSINGLNLYSYANNNPIGIAYSSSGVGFGDSGAMVSSLSLGGKFTPSNNGLGGNFTKDWINLKTVPSWVETVIDVADVGFSASIVGLTAWYTLKYPGVADLMKLDGIASIPGKYADFVEGLGYAFVFVETGIDVYNNWQKGQSAGYILASGAYTFGTGMVITWGSAKLGAYIGTSIGGPFGFIVGGVAGILIGLGLEWLADEIKELIF